MAAYVIPLTPSTNQNLICTIPVNSQNLTLTFQFTFNSIGGYWYMSITDSTNTLLLDAVPLVGGNYPAGNLLKQYQYLEIGSAYLIPVSSGLPDIPNFSDLGTDFLLVWSDNVAQ